MRVEVKVLLRNQISLPETAMCTVEIRDVSLLDAPSITVSSHQAPATQILGKILLTDTFEIPDSDTISRDLNIWAHLSLTGEKRVQSGDYITMSAYPIKATSSVVSVTVALQLVR